MKTPNPQTDEMIDQLMQAFRPKSGLATDINDDDVLATPLGQPPEVTMLRLQQQQALQEIMGGKSYTNAAAAAGVDRKTVYNWAKKDPAFQAALAAWRNRLEQHARDELTAATAAAARTFALAAATNWRAAAVLLTKRALFSDAKLPADHLLSGLDALPPQRRAQLEKQIRALIEGKPPEHLPEIRALQERMLAEEAAAVPAKVPTPEKTAADAKKEGDAERA